MRVVEYVGGTVRLAEREQAIARPEETVLRVSRVGICGTDLGAVQRGTPSFSDGIIIGHELVGIGISDGARFTSMPLITCSQCAYCKNGAENLCEARAIVGAHMDGFLSDTITLPASRLIPLPDDVTDAQAALIEPMATALHAWRRAAPGDNWRVGVIGAGAIGLCIAWVARAHGAWSVIAEVDETKHFTAAAIANEAVGELVDVFDAVFDTVGLATTRIGAIEATRPGRPTVFVGLHSADMPVHGSDLVARERNLLGSFAYTMTDFADAINYVRSISTDWVTTVTLEEAIDLINGDTHVPGAMKLHVVMN